MGGISGRGQDFVRGAAVHGRHGAASFLVSAPGLYSLRGRQACRLEKRRRRRRRREEGKNEEKEKGKEKEKKGLTKPTDWKPSPTRNYRSARPLLVDSTSFLRPRRILSTLRRRGRSFRESYRMMTKSQKEWRGGKWGLIRGALFVNSIVMLSYLTQKRVGRIWFLPIGVFGEPSLDSRGLGGRGWCRGKKEGGGGES